MSAFYFFHLLLLLTSSWHIRSKEKWICIKLTLKLQFLEILWIFCSYLCIVKLSVLSINLPPLKFVIMNRSCCVNNRVIVPVLWTTSNKITIQRSLHWNPEDMCTNQVCASIHGNYSLPPSPFFFWGGGGDSRFKIWDLGVEHLETVSKIVMYISFLESQDP